MEAPAALEEVTVEYTCPMHPEVRQIGPGSCPKCGMALEPVSVNLAALEEVNPEYIDMRRRFWFSVGPTAVLLVLMYASVHASWIECILATPVVLWAGWPLFERGWASLVNRSLNMFTLIATGVAAAYLYSLVATLAPGRFFQLHFASTADNPRSTLSRRPSSLPWSCSVRCWSCVRAARPAARSSPYSVCAENRPPNPNGRDRRRCSARASALRRSIASPARASEFQWMAPWWKGPVSWTNR